MKTAYITHPPDTTIAPWNDRARRRRAPSANSHQGDGR